MKGDLAERTRRIAQQARGYADAKGTAKPQPAADAQPGTPAEPVEYPTPARHHWRINRWGEDPIDVIVAPAQTQAQMRERYPQAAGILPIE